MTVRVGVCLVLIKVAAGVPLPLPLLLLPLLHTGTVAFTLTSTGVKQTAIARRGMQAHSAS